MKRQKAPVSDASKPEAPTSDETTERVPRSTEQHPNEMRKAAPKDAAERFLFSLAIERHLLDGQMTQPASRPERASVPAYRSTYSSGTQTL